MRDRFEAYFGRSAYAHLFVTRAMRDFLAKEWNLQYDFPLFSAHIIDRTVQRPQSRPTRSPSGAISSRFPK